MKTTVLLRAVHLMGWLVLLIFGAPIPSAAQDATPQLLPKITPLWTSTQKLCQPDIYCEDIWELSADNEHLFVYINTTSTMYVFSKGIDKVKIYPMPQLSQSLVGSFKYLPLDDHIILYSDDLNNRALTRLDLLTGESHIFGREVVLESCLANVNMFDGQSAFFHYLPKAHALLVCRNLQYGPVSRPKFISTVNLKSGQLTDVAYLGYMKYDHIKVIGGRDGGIYLEPLLWPRKAQLIMRLNIQTSTWDSFEFPEFNLPDYKDRFFEFAKVDTQSNIYFQSSYDKDMNQNLVIVKADLTGKVLQVIKQDQLGWNAKFIDLDANGQMIILNQMSLPSANTTVDVISRYEFDVAEK